MVVVSRFRAVCQEPLARLAYTNPYLSTYRPTSFFSPLRSFQFVTTGRCSCHQRPRKFDFARWDDLSRIAKFLRGTLTRQRSIEPSPFFHADSLILETEKFERKDWTRAEFCKKERRSIELFIQSWRQTIGRANRRNGKRRELQSHK